MKKKIFEQAIRLVPTMVLFAFFAPPLFGYEHPGLMHTMQELEAAHDNAARNQLLGVADAALGNVHHAVSNFYVPGFYVDEAGHRAAKEGIGYDTKDAYACALAWHLTDNATYANKALYFLNAWAGTNTSISSADDSYLSMAYIGPGLVFAADLMYNYSGWANADREKFKTWATNILKKAGDGIKNRTNNWADWGVLASISAAYFLDDVTAVNSNIERIKQLINSQIAESGVLPEEEKRGERHTWYAYFTLAPLTAAMQVAQNATGVNLYTYNNSRVKTALDYYFPLWQNPPADQLLKERAFNLLEAMNYVYNVPEWEAYLAPERPIMRDVHHFAWTFPTLMAFTIKQDSVYSAIHSYINAQNGNIPENLIDGDESDGSLCTIMSITPSGDAYVCSGSYQNNNNGTKPTLNKLLGRGRHCVGANSAAGRIHMALSSNSIA